MPEILVAKSGKADFRSIQKAIDSVRVYPFEPVTIHVHAGIYQERIIVPDNKPNLRIVGKDRESTIITGSDYAEMADSSGEKIGTFRTAVLYAHADNFRMENITVRNTAGYGPHIGQALAVYISGDRCLLRDVNLIGNQDTLFASRGRHVYLNCLIAGHVDFIFGAASAFFHECTLHSLRGGYITAPSTSEDSRYGFIFIDCRLTGPAKEQTVFLGRPWRPHASALFIDCWMDRHIKPEGWDNWRSVSNESTSRFGETGSCGPGGLLSKRVPWAMKITEDQADLYRKLLEEHMLDTN